MEQNIIHGVSILTEQLLVCKVSCVNTSIERVEWQGFVCLGTSKDNFGSLILLKIETSTDSSNNVVLTHF